MIGECIFFALKRTEAFIESRAENDKMPNKTCCFTGQQPQRWQEWGEWRRLSTCEAVLLIADTAGTALHSRRIGTWATSCTNTNGAGNDVSSNRSSSNRTKEKTVVYFDVKWVWQMGTAVHRLRDGRADGRATARPPTAWLAFVVLPSQHATSSAARRIRQRRRHLKLLRVCMCGVVLLWACLTEVPLVSKFLSTTHSSFVANFPARGKKERQSVLCASRIHRRIEVVVRLVVRARLGWAQSPCRTSAVQHRSGDATDPSSRGRFGWVASAAFSKFNLPPTLAIVGRCCYCWGRRKGDSEKT